MDIQNTGTLTGEKLKKKFCSLKLTRPPDEFVIFDTRPQDDLTTTNMDPWLKSTFRLINMFIKSKVGYMYGRCVNYESCCVLSVPDTLKRVNY